MNTTPKHQQNDEMKQLFRELFNVQIKLECYLDQYDPKKRVIIQLIDELLERMLDSTE
jgi:hypothetical protein